MGVSLAEVAAQLLAGKSFAWKKSKSHKAGNISLNSAGERRLFEFLLRSDQAKVAGVDESLITDLIAAWDNIDHDPAKSTIGEKEQQCKDSWRLEKIEAFGFGGLTAFAGEPFELLVGGANWCLEGQNGSGKTSLNSAILWALTGKRIRDHEGPVDDLGTRQEVLNDDGEKIGTWPPLVSYPPRIADLAKAAEVWVRLTFKNASGETAIAFRRSVVDAAGNIAAELAIDARLQTGLRMAEISVLMPARLSKMSFGKGSVSLYESVKQLTGLDQLADIAEGAAGFGAGNRKFMKYAKDHGIDTYENRFADNLVTAKRISAEFEIKLPDPLLIGEKDIEKSLREVAQTASVQAGDYLETLKTEIPADINTANAEGRTKVKDAVSFARGVVNEGPTKILLFKAWKLLRDAPAEAAFAGIPIAIEAAKKTLETGLAWHERQTKDSKLRLKALAAQGYDPTDPKCPVCITDLKGEQGEKVAAELQELKANAGEAERKIADVCRGIVESLRNALPVALTEMRSMIDAMEPAAAYTSAMQKHFAEDSRFSKTLTGLTAFVQKTLATQSPILPIFSFAEFAAQEDESDIIRNVRKDIHAVERLLSLIEWWKEARSQFGDAWNSLVGKKGEDGKFPIESIEGKLEILEKALAQAKPLDELSKALETAATAAERWKQISAEQQKREKIKLALEPLKELRTLVGAETATTIADLSGTIEAICKRISLRERLSYQEAVIGRKEVSVTASFEAGMRFDASQVANTSWLRAILWSFVFALREQTLNALGYNPLPLVVLDDPQVTFDPRNKRRWAEELVRYANLAPTELLGSQLLVTTHERNFYQMLIDHEKFAAQQGLIGAVNKISGVATIANGGELTRLFEEARVTNSDERAREYIRRVRIYCEDLLKFMLRSIGADIPDMNLDKLRAELRKLSDAHVAPFDRRAFGALIGALNASQKAVQYLNGPPHNESESYGLAEAETVKAYWEKTLLERIHTAFGVYDTFELYTGEPRTFPWAKNVVEFPDGHRAIIKRAKMKETGVAAAAKSDGRAGDGVLTVKEWEGGNTVVLPNHDVFQLAAGTLDPVAAIGDLIIVSNYAKIRERNLVVTISGNSLLARRYNRPENHSEIVVLTGQAVDPTTLPSPVIVQPSAEFRKIVGTIFTSHLIPPPSVDFEKEFVAVPDPILAEKLMNGAKLFRVDGRSAEPIALEGQRLITRDKPVKGEDLKGLDGRLVVAVDENGTRYFKRMRCHTDVVVLESLNPDGVTPSEVLSWDGKAHPKISEALEVVGVLFDLPDIAEGSE